MVDLLVGAAHAVAAMMAMGAKKSIGNILIWGRDLDKFLELLVLLGKLVS